MIFSRIAVALRRQDWLAFAIELVLVIVGILIALQIDNWNTTRKERDEERQYLAAIASELEANSKRLEELIQFNQRYLESVNLITASLDKPAGDVDRRALTEAFGLTLNLSATRLNSGVYDELVSAGKLQLLQSSTLRQDLISYYRSLNSTAQLEATSLANWQSSYTPFLEEHFNTQVMFQAWAADFSQTQNYQPPVALYLRPLPEDIFWELPPESPEKRRFSNLLSRLFSDHLFSHYAQQDLLTRTQRLLLDIQSGVEAAAEPAETLQ